MATTAPPMDHAEPRGDLPNLIVNDAFQGRLNTTTERVTLQRNGDHDVVRSPRRKVGSAIVIHANRDDFGSTRQWQQRRSHCLRRHRAQVAFAEAMGPRLRQVAMVGARPRERRCQRLAARPTLRATPAASGYELAAGVERSGEQLGLLLGELGLGEDAAIFEVGELGQFVGGSAGCHRRSDV